MTRTTIFLANVDVPRGDKQTQHELQEQWTDDFKTFSHISKVGPGGGLGKRVGNLGRLWLGFPPNLLLFVQVLLLLALHEEKLQGNRGCRPVLRNIVNH